MFNIGQKVWTSYLNFSHFSLQLFDPEWAATYLMKFILQRTVVINIHVLVSAHLVYQLKQ